MPKLVIYLLASVTMCFFYSCKKSETLQRFPIEVVVQSPTQAPLESASVLIDDKLVGTTSPQGNIEFDVNGLVGDTKKLAIVCPNNWDTKNNTIRFVLREFSPLGNTQELRALRHSFVCTPEKVKVAVAINASGKANLPVLFEGKTLGRTNENGIAHVVLESKPEERITLLIDTQNETRLQPQNPTKTFEIGTADAIYTFEQTFDKQRPKRKRKAQPHRPQLVPMPIR